MDSTIFRFMALPKELRYNVIEYLLDDIFPPKGAQLPYVLPCDEPKNGGSPYVDLLLMNKQIQEETEYLF